MGKLSNKTICDWSKSDIEDEIELLAEIVDSPRFVCRKCGRAAGRKRNLCKPRKLPELDRARAPEDALAPRPRFEIDPAANPTRSSRDA